MWESLAGPQPIAEAVEFFQYVVFNDPAWDYTTLSFDTAADVADKAAGGVLNVIDPNLKPFFDRGGKLLLYHGWNDQFVSPVNSINYYNEHPQPLRATKGPSTDSIWLFMVPGMNHCRGGEGPNTFDADRDARALGRAGPHAGPDGRVARDGRHDRPDAAAVRLSDRWRATTAPAASTTRPTSRCRVPCRPPAGQRAAI